MEQNKKQVLMIHEVRDWMFDLPLSDYILTFDDGLYSQYHYIDKFLEYNTPMYFFVSSGIVCEGTQSTGFPTCSEAHKKAFSGNKEDYMTVKQLKHLQSLPNVTIGAHSHSHKSVDGMKLVELIEHVTKDTELMLDWFDTNLGFKPHTFCFPYNKNPQNFYSAYLRKYGFTEFVGSERTPVEKLQRP